jgi:hypothetical protein
LQDNKETDQRRYKVRGKKAKYDKTFSWTAQWTLRGKKHFIEVSMPDTPQLDRALLVVGVP